MTGYSLSVNCNGCSSITAQSHWTPVEVFRHACTIVEETSMENPANFLHYSLIYLLFNFDTFYKCQYNNLIFRPRREA